jgi:diguanylate cyclase (GGDEF)-like protein
MAELSRSQAQLLARHVAAFSERLEREVAAPIAAQLRGCQPAEVAEALSQLALLGRSLEVRTKRATLHPALLPLVKRVLIEQRRAVAEAIDEPLQKAVDGGVIRMLRRELLSIESLTEGEWFARTQALRLPAITDYMSIRHAEAALPQPLSLAPRAYDEKFHILEAPGLFLLDLAYYRRRCRIRDASIAVAYLDIDDFKAYNTRHTETTIDLVLLGPLMEVLEAHVFAHGHVYRFGGDEYVLILPNMSETWALPFLRALQERIANASFRGVERPPTLSVGLFVVDVDCPLTDREILSRANQAKNSAKEQEKGRIVEYSD